MAERGTPEVRTPEERKQQLEDRLQKAELKLDRLNNLPDTADPEERKQLVKDIHASWEHARQALGGMHFDRDFWDAHPELKADYEDFEGRAGVVEVEMNDINAQAFYDAAYTSIQSVEQLPTDTPLLEMTDAYVRALEALERLENDVDLPLLKNSSNPAMVTLADNIDTLVGLLPELEQRHDTARLWEEQQHTIQESLQAVEKQIADLELMDEASMSLAEKFDVMLEARAQISALADACESLEPGAFTGNDVLRDAVEQVLSHEDAIVAWLIDNAEHLEVTEKKERRKSLFKAVGTGLLGAAASVFGVKALHDVPKYFVERHNVKLELNCIAVDISVVMQELDTYWKDGQVPEADDLAVLKDQLLTQINESERFTDEQRAALEKRIEDEFEKRIEAKDTVQQTDIELSELAREAGLSDAQVSRFEREYKRAIEKYDLDKVQELAASIQSAIANSNLTEKERHQKAAAVEQAMETLRNDIEKINQDFSAELQLRLEKEIHRSVTGGQMLRELTNSALVLTGATAMRAGAFGAAALVARVRREKASMIEEGKELGFLEGNGELFNRVFVDALKETASDLGAVIDTEADMKDRGKRLARGVMNVARVAGFAGLIGAEQAFDEANFSVGELIDGLQEQGVLKTAKDNFLGNFARVGSMFKRLGEFVNPFDGSETDALEVPTDDDDSAFELGGDDDDSTDAETSTTPEEAPPAEPVAAVDTPDATEPVSASSDSSDLIADSKRGDAAMIDSIDGSAELREGEIARGLVRKGDSIIGIAKRQLEARAAEFGFDGDVSDQSAVKAWADKQAHLLARDGGFLNADSDVRLSTESIGNTVVRVVSDGEGGFKIDLADKETLQSLSSDAREAMTYKGPGGAPEAAEAAVEAPPTESSASSVHDMLVERIKQDADTLGVGDLDEAALNVFAEEMATDLGKQYNLDAYRATDLDIENIRITSANDYLDLSFLDSATGAEIPPEQLAELGYVERIDGAETISSGETLSAPETGKTEQHLFQLPGRDGSLLIRLDGAAAFDKEGVLTVDFTKDFRLSEKELDAAERMLRPRLFRGLSDVDRTIVSRTAIKVQEDLVKLQAIEGLNAEPDLANRLKQSVVDHMRGMLNTSEELSPRALKLPPAVRQALRRYS